MTTRPAILLRLLSAVAAVLTAPAADAATALVPEVVIEGRFNAAEGLAFSSSGRLYMVANRAVWEVHPDGSTTKLADSASNLGLAALGAEDIAHADFGPRTWPRDGANDDGVVWRITPEGDKTPIARGIGDPNAIVVLPGGRLLVSDDFTNNIYSVAPDGEVRVFTDAIPFPNGLALAPDGSALYVAQIFSAAPEGPLPRRFTEFSDRVWKLPLAGGEPAASPELLFETGGESGPDGLAMGPDGMLYLTAARAGQLWRIDPATRSGELLADDFPGLASLAFGRGAFDSSSLYVVQIRGGRLLRFPNAAASLSAPPMAGDPTCASQELFATLDFWIGDWEVFAGERKVGDNRVAKALQGCAITESWSAADGDAGQSLYYVEPAEMRWKQVWVTGRALAPGGLKEKRLVETLPGGGLRFQGIVRDAAGRSWLDRTTLAARPDGSVRQHIETSTDEGATWSTSFDAIYRRRAH